MDKITQVTVINHGENTVDNPVRGLQHTRPFQIGVQSHHRQGFRDSLFFRQSGNIYIPKTMVGEAGYIGLPAFLADVFIKLYSPGAAKHQIPGKGAILRINRFHILHCDALSFHCAYPQSAKACRIQRKFKQMSVLNLTHTNAGIFSVRHHRRCVVGHTQTLWCLCRDCRIPVTVVKCRFPPGTDFPACIITFPFPKVIV